MNKKYVVLIIVAALVALFVKGIIGLVVYAALCGIISLIFGGKKKLKVFAICLVVISSIVFIEFLFVMYTNYQVSQMLQKTP